MADVAQIDEPANRTQKMILWMVIVQRELIKQRRLCFLLRSHHSSVPRCDRKIESADAPQIKDSYSTELTQVASQRWNNSTGRALKTSGAPRCEIANVWPMPAISPVRVSGIMM